MKLSVKFYQENSMYSFEYETDKIKNNQLSKIVGTACDRMFKFVDTAKITNAKVFNLTKPVHLWIDVNDKPFLDTSVDERLSAGLKLQRTKKGERRFAIRTYEIAKFALSEIVVKSVADFKEE